MDVLPYEQDQFRLLLPFKRDDVAEKDRIRTVNIQLPARRAQYS